MPVAGSTTTLQPNSSSCALAAATRVCAFGRREHAGDLGLVALLEIPDRGEHRVVAAGRRRDSRPTTAAPPGFSGVRRAGCRRTHRAPARLWLRRFWARQALLRRQRVSRQQASQRRSVQRRASPRHGLSLTVLPLADLVSAGLLSVGSALAAAAFRLTCFLAGVASDCLGAGMMPGESCASAGPAPTSSASTTRNGPLRIVFNATLTMFCGTLADRGSGARHQEAGRNRF